MHLGQATKEILEIQLLEIEVWQKKSLNRAIIIMATKYSLCSSLVIM